MLLSQVFNIFFVLPLVFLSSCVTSQLGFKEGLYKNEPSIVANYKFDFAYLIHIDKEEIEKDLENEFKKLNFIRPGDSRYSSELPKFEFREQISMNILRNEYADKFKMLYIFSCLIYCENTHKEVWIKLSILKDSKVVHEIEKKDIITYRQSLVLLPGILIMPFQNITKSTTLNLHRRVLEQALADQDKWVVR